MQFGRAHHIYADDHGDVGRRVDGEAPAKARRHDEQSRERRAEDARDVDDRAVHDDGVRQILLRHHLADERSAKGIVERQNYSAGDGERIQPEKRRMVHEGQDRKSDGLGHFQALGPEQQLALVDAIGDGAGFGRKEKYRPELAGRHDADAQSAARYLEHEQGERDIGEPVSRIRNELTREVEAEIAIAERDEGLFHR